MACNAQAFGVLSERGALKGILSAGLIPLIAGLLGGTRVKCGGPTGPMTTVTYDLIDYAKLSEDGLATDRPDVDPDLFVNWTILFAVRSSCVLSTTAPRRLPTMI